MLTLERSAHATELLEQAERLLDERFVDEAWNCFLTAESAGADLDHCSAGRWQAAMLRGNFEAAWKESDAIRLRGSAGANGLWSGEDIDGKRLIVRCLHGFGDAVQMLRYAPRLRERAADVTFEGSPKLLPLMRCFPGVERAIAWTDPNPVWDIQVEVMELPYLFRTTMKELPVAERYLSVPKQQLDNAATHLGRKLRPRVGLVWTCGDWNPARNVPPAELAALADLDVEFWNLQAPSSLDRCTALPLRDGGQLTDGLLPLAATIANLDLVITPDTLAAHLAGALRKPAFVMLQFAADWRWMMDRSSSPWYPSVRLFRQPAPGDWSSVIQAIKAELRTSVL